MSSYSVYDLCEQAVAAFHSFMENEKFVAKSALSSVKRRGPSSRSRGDSPHRATCRSSPVSTEGYPVDLETGEVMEPVTETSTAEEAYPQIYLPNEEEGYSKNGRTAPRAEDVAEEEDMDEEVTVDFHTLRNSFNTNFQRLISSHPDKPKNQSKEKTSFARTSAFGRDLASF